MSSSGTPVFGDFGAYMKSLYREMEPRRLARLEVGTMMPFGGSPFYDFQEQTDLPTARALERVAAALDRMAATLQQLQQRDRDIEELRKRIEAIEKARAMTIEVNP